MEGPISRATSQRGNASNVREMRETDTVAFEDNYACIANISAAHSSLQATLPKSTERRGQAMSFRNPAHRGQRAANRKSARE